MNYIIKAVIIVSIFCSCQRNLDKADFVNHPPIEKDTIQWINKWSLTGPFQFDTLKQSPEEAYHNNYLEAFGLKASDLTLRKIPNDLKSKTHHILSSHQYIDFFKFVGDTIKDLSCFYAHAAIESPRAMSRFLVLSGASSYSVWLNGQKVIEVRGKKNTSRKADKFLRIKLRKGLNHLVVKSGRDTNKKAWKLMAGISGEGFAKQLFKYCYFRDFIVNPLVKDSIRFYTGPFSEGEILIQPISSKKVLLKSQLNPDKGNSILSVSSLKERHFYRCQIAFGRDTISEVFYKGALSFLLDQVYHKTNKLLTSQIPEPENNDIRANLARVSHLKNRASVVSSKSWAGWISKNVVFWSNALLNLMQQTNNPTESMKTGTFLKAFQAQDGAQKSFIFHVGNETASKDSIPLIMVVPVEVFGKSLVTSWYAGNFPQIEYDCQLADSIGAAICWLFMDGENYTPESKDEAITVLETLKKEYPVSSETWLMGHCVGASRALELAVKHPGTFKGLALFSPSSFNITTGQLATLKNSPFFISHGRYDRIIPIDKTRDFVELAGTHGIDIQFNTPPKGHLNIHPAYQKNAFWFIKKSMSN